MIVIKEGKVLMGLRKGAHGEGTWSFPGGHLEFGETLKQCALREVGEEVGIEIANLRHGEYTNDVFEKEDKHYITLYIVADWIAGEPKVLEVDKCEKWAWFSWDDMPENVFLPIENLKKLGYNPFV